WAEWTTLT
ncbi:hypothetical protein D046_0284B, partial [Vibrio parahaemolyticus V-223/04]